MKRAGMAVVSDFGSSRAGARPYVRWSQAASTTGPRGGAGDGLCWGAGAGAAELDGAGLACTTGGACTTGDGVSPPTGLSPAGAVGVTGAAPEVPGVSPVDAETLGAGVLGAAVGSWEAVALDTAVAMSVAAAGTLRRPIDGMRGRPADLATWRCSGCWCPCCCPAEAGVEPDAEPCEEPVPLGAVALPDDAPLPETRLASVGFTECVGALGLLGVPGVLGNSTVEVLVARGISGRRCGSTAGCWPVL